MKVVFPTRAIMLLIGIGMVDLISTAWLYHAGLIQEKNPLMRYFLDKGEWPFVFVKGATLVATWITLAMYTKHNRTFVRNSCLIGSAAYAGLWVVWFCAGS